MAMPVGLEYFIAELTDFVLVFLLVSWDGATASRGISSPLKWENPNLLEDILRVSRAKTRYKYWVQYDVETGSTWVFCGIFNDPNLVTCGISAIYKSKRRSQ
jgi:hypothetical protein